jgi:hypothetical protein
MQADQGDDNRPTGNTTLLSTLLSGPPSETPEERQEREALVVEIVRKQSTGRSQAFEAFASIMVEGAKSRVRAQVRQKVRTKEDADELTNRILFKGFEYFYKEGILKGQFDPKKGSLLQYYLGACWKQTNWVVMEWIRSQVAANHLIAELFQKDPSYDEQRGAASSGPIPEQVCLDREAIEELIRRLPEDKRGMAKSIAFEDASRDTLAQQENTTKRGIEGRVKRLRKNVQGRDQDPESG